MSYLNLYAEAKYEDRDTTLPNEDYDQLRLTLGVKPEDINLLGSSR
jgi:hypothetical protein